ALNQRRHPAAAVAWVMMIVLLPEIGVPLYLLFGTRKLPKARRDPAATFIAEAPADVVPPWVQRLSAAMSLPPAREYTRLAVHDDGRAARIALLETVDSARSRLDVSTFILGRDAFGDEFLGHLERRARAGVQVRLLIDGVGTWMGGRNDFSAALAAGVQVARFMPPLRSPFRWPLRGRTNLRNHRKLVIADGQRLWSGGRNLSGEYFEGTAGRAPWIDLSFDLEGDVAGEAAAVFDADWTFAGSASRGDVSPPAGRAWPQGRVSAPAAQMLPSGPDYADDTVHTLLLTSCYRARNRILVVTPYLVPDESLLLALSLAARRGVSVDILVPAHSNHRLADISRNRPMRELAAAGARLWLSPAMVHAKAVVIDEHMAMVGSVNLDSRSLFLNYELMVGFYHPADIVRFTAWIDARLADAMPYRAHAPGLARSIGEGLVLWLAFQL
ncbi:MAG TPA: phospholipase D-like domain-containing protein, partial [Burkholderiaceae bacterium]|nr:phospholipase D-like domain-containing protein [Burkholderiaceae bacterium]